MAIYKYKARNMDGQIITGEQEADSESALKQFFGEKGFFVISSDKQATQLSFGGGGRATMKDISILCRQFSVILGAGIPVLTAISILRDQTERKKLSAVLDEVHEDLQKGSILSEAMDKHERVFPSFMRNMIKVGEMSGTLESILDKLAVYYERETAIRKKIKSAMTYPIILLVLSLVVVIGLLVFIVPMFSGVLGSMGAEMPGITKFFIALSKFMTTNIIAIIVVIAAVVGGTYAFSQTNQGKFFIDKMMVSIPVIKTTTNKLITSRFARSMSILLKSGIPIVEAIEMMSALLGNRVVEERFVECKDKVKQGRGLAGPIKSINIFPPLLIHMVSVGEQTGELDSMLAKTSDFFDAEVEEAVTAMTAFIQPVMILFLAGIICSIILSIMLPMTSIMDAISQ
jgi:type IV pilus assembly protein PilC